MRLEEPFHRTWFVCTKRRECIKHAFSHCPEGTKEEEINYLQAQAFFYTPGTASDLNPGFSDFFFTAETASLEQQEQAFTKEVFLQTQFEGAAITVGKS